MAALLRSARLLKFTPSGLLHITGPQRNGAPLGRLYSGTLGSSRTGGCSRHIRAAAEKQPSHVWPYTAGCVRRSYTVASEQKDEASLAVRSKQAQHFDWALAKLDSSVRRTGRITKTLMLSIFHDICRTGYPSGNQALLLLRSCGSLLPEVALEERTELAHRVWEKLQGLGAQYDVSHYNALLKVYLQNDFKFSPTDFLAKMEAAKVQPNRVTYQRLIAAYCQNGDIEGASTILGFMKSKDLPITEAVFNSLVTGHARSGDIESAKNILTVMRGAGIEPGPDTYISLLNAYAEKGDLESLKKTLEEAESADCSLMDRDIMQVIFTSAKAGHHQLVPAMVERLRHERGYVPDAMNLCLSLITQGLEDTAFLILKTFPSLQSDDLNADNATLGNFFLRHCVNMDTAIEKISRYCNELQELKLHSKPLTFTLFCALESKKSEMSIKLMEMMKEQDLPIRPHYFWPLLTLHVKDNNTAGVVEVMTGMQKLGVAPNAETVSNYVIPAFRSVTAARQALKGAGISLDLEGYAPLEVRSLALSNLAELYALLSDPSFTALDQRVFRGSLIQGFQKSNDVESMAKITELLFKDTRFCKDSDTPAENAAYFLYNLIDNMPAGEVQTQEVKLQKFFSQLKAQNVTIPENIYKGIRNLLMSYHVPALIKGVLALVDPKDQVATDAVSTPGISSLGAKVTLLEKKLAELKAENKPYSGTLKQIIQTLCVDENLQRALELKQQHEAEMTAATYAILINLCCNHDNVDEALNLKREMTAKEPSVVLDVNKYMALVRALAKSGRVDEAVDTLKEMKEMEVVLSDTNITALFHTLSVVAQTGAAPVRRLQDAVFTLGLAKPTANLCSPLVSAYLDGNDLPGALDAALECYKLYKQLPRIHDIIVGLVEKGDTDLLQKAMDFVNQERGEMSMLYDLFFAFLQTGRYREARKIVETPGLRARPGRLQWYAEKCISSNQPEALEQMVDMTAKLFECDRDEMYSYVLRLYKDTNNWQKAEATWTKMQEENLIPRERTLRLLADILRANGQEVPFETPETWYQQDEEAFAPAAPAPPTPAMSEQNAQYQGRILALCKRGKIQEAIAMLKEADKEGVALGAAIYDHLIRALLSNGSPEDAMSVKDMAEVRSPGFQLRDIANSLFIITYSKKGQCKEALENLRTMLQADQVPSPLSITRLVQALGNHGDVAGIQEVETLVKTLGTHLTLSSMVFLNNMALANIKNGEVEKAVELLEEVYTQPYSSASTSPSMSFVFRRILEDNDDKAMDKLSAMAERLANHFACYRPALDLFLQLVDMDKVEDAKFMLARVNALAEQKELLTSFVARKAQNPGQLGKVKALLELIPDFIEKPFLYPYLMKCHIMDKDLASAKALYEQIQKEGLAMDELSLKRLAVLYKNAGETAPFAEPPESFRFYAEKLRKQVAEAKSPAE